MNRNAVLIGSWLLAMTASFSFAKDSPVTASSTTAVKKFGIKSAVVTMTMDMTPGSQVPAGVPAMASSGTITMTFDDFGAKESIANETAMEMMGMKVNAKSQTIIKDGYVYIIDTDKKSGTKSRVLKIDDPTKLDFANASPDYLKKWNIKKEGTETVAGKTCEVYSFKTDDIHAASGETKAKGKIPMEGKCSVWNNIGLKADFVINGSMNIKMEATKVDETAAIPATAFDVPADVKLKEAKE